jgi:hypothetical protein
MPNPIIAITEKVMRMIKSMVYLSMRVDLRRGATVVDIENFLVNWAPSESDMYHQGIIERVLRELRDEGRVTQAGPRYYLTGAYA